MKRSKPLHRSTPLHRSRGINRRNPKRLRRLREAAFGEQAARCEKSRCPACLTGRLDESVGGRIVAHHEHSRGAGGKDDATVPLCWSHHALRHSRGPSFWTIVGVDISELLAFMRTPGAVVDESWLRKWNESNLPVSPWLGWLE